MPRGIDTLATVCLTLGAPEYLRSQYGGEFVARVVSDWLIELGCQNTFIARGHPWENSCAKSLMGKLQYECLSDAATWNVCHAQVVAEWP